MTDHNQLKVLFGEHFIECTPVGSRRTCDPAPTDTDDDWLVLAHPGYSECFYNSGFNLDNPSKHYAPEYGMFNSWRQEDVNLIVTEDRSFYERFVRASQLAKAMNITDRKHRIILFQFVLYDSLPDAELVAA